LYFEWKLGQRQIARSANISQSTVHEYLTRFTAAGLSWPLPTEMSESDLHALHVVAIPDWLQERVGKAEVKQILDRFLAKVMIDSQKSPTRERNDAGFD